MRSSIRHNSRMGIAMMLLIISSSFVLPSTAVQAADYVVTRCDETGFDNALSSIQSDPAPEGTISFNCGVASTTIDFSTQKLIIGRITIDGGNAVVLSGMRATRLFEVQSDASLALRNIVIEKGLDNATSGGAIQVNQNGALYAVKSTFRQNRSGASGGAIHSYLGSVGLVSSILEDNEAAYGGALAHNGGTLVLSDTQILRNMATTGDGGGLQVWNANSNLTLVGFDGNKADADLGGALSIKGGSSMLLGGFMANNSAKSGGGVAAWDGAKLKMSYASLGLNIASVDGGGLHATGDSSIELSYLTMQGNQAYNGGGINQLGGTAMIRDSLFLLNKSSNGPGGALLLAGGSFDIQRSIVRDNRAVNNAGGGVYSTGKLHLTNVHIEQNSAAAPGAGLRLVSSTAWLTNTTVYNNAGYGISSRNVLSGAIILRNSIVGRNTPANCDGGLRETNHRYSFSDDASCTELTGATNRTNAKLSFENIELQLGAQSLTIGVPTRSSPSVDFIPASECIPIDLRGMARPQGRACDAGAIERQGFGVYLPMNMR